MLKVRPLFTIIYQRFKVKLSFYFIFFAFIKQLLEMVLNIPFKVVTCLGIFVPLFTLHFP